MKRFAILAFVALLSLPVSAQTDGPENGDIGEGVDLLGEGARQLFRGLVDRVQPSLRDLARDLQELNWNGIKIEDLDDYNSPEMLPNGDIILRRKPEASRPLDEGEIEL